MIVELVDRYAAVNGHAWSSSQGWPLVGSHRVVISKAETRGVAADQDGLSGAVSDGGWQFIEYLPAKYARPNTSGLTANVESNMNNEFTFELTEKADE